MPVRASQPQAPSRQQALSQDLCGCSVRLRLVPFPACAACCAMPGSKDLCRLLRQVANRAADFLCMLRVLGSCLLLTPTNAGTSWIGAGAVWEVTLRPRHIRVSFSVSRALSDGSDASPAGVYDSVFAGCGKAASFHMLPCRGCASLGRWPA